MKTSKNKREFNSLPFEMVNKSTYIAVKGGGVCVCMQEFKCGM